MSSQQPKNDMRRATFNVLAELYRFIGQFESNDLLVASRRSELSPHLRVALTALAKEMSGDERRGAVTSERQRKSRSTATVPVVKAGMEPNKIRKKLQQYFGDSKKFPTKESLGEFARKVGLDFRVDAKSARPRTINRLIGALLDNKEACEKAGRELGLRRDPETQGWFDLIVGQ